MVSINRKTYFWAN